MTKILIKRGQAEANLPTLDPGEPAITFESGGKLWIGTPSGNLEITGGGGGGTPGGSDTQVQFNDGGSFGGSASFVFNKTTGDVTINGDVTGSSFITSGGSSSQFVKGDGSLDSTAYISGPAGSDTQIQFNNGGDFGGDSGFVFNDSTKVITLTSSQQSDSFIDIVHDGTTSTSNERSLDFYAINSGASSVLYTSLSFGSPGVSPGSEFGSMVFSVRDSGSMVNVLKIDPFELVFNEDGADRNTRWEGDTATHLFVTDAGLDAVQIGTTTAGDIADFRSTAIVFNESGADRDFRIEGDTVENLLFIDAGNNRVGIGTSSPSVEFEVSGKALFSAVTGSAGINIFKAESSNEGGYFSVQDGSGTGFLPTFVFSSSSTNVGGSFNALVGTDTNDVNRSAFIFSARNSAGNGALSNVDLFQVANYTTIAFKIWNNGGVTIGSPSGGSKGAGTLNTAGDIYKNNSAFTNPDYVFEKYFTGKIERYIKNQGAKDYSMTSLAELKDYVKSNLHLPKRPSGALGIFERSDWIQEKLEELAIYIIELHDRIDKLEKGMV